MDNRTGRFLLGAVLLLFLVNTVKGGEPDYLLSLSEFIVVSAGVFWLCRTMSDAKPSFKASVATLPAFLFAGALSISTLFAANRYASFKGLYENLSYLALFLICMNFDERTARRTAYILIAAAATQSVVAVGQALAGTERVAGTLTYPTYLLDTLIIGLSLAGAFALFEDRSRKRALLIFGPLLSVMFFALFLTRARAGLVAMGASFVVLGALKSKKMLGLLIAVVVAASVVPNPIRDRILSAGKQDIYAMKRAEIWKQAVVITGKKPTAGTGMRNYVYYSRMTNFPVDEAVGRYAKIAKIAHNQYLQYAAETGLAGLAAFLLLIGTVVWSGMRSVKGRDPVVIGSLAAWSALLAHCLVDNALYLPINAYAFFALGGFLAAAPGRTRAYRALPRAKVYVIILACIFAIVALRPGVSICFYNSALRKAGRGQIAEAIRSCRKALLIAPSEAVYHDALAKLYAKRFDENKSAGYLYMVQRRHVSAIECSPMERQFWEDYADFIYNHKTEFGVGQAYSDLARLLVKATELDPFNPFLRNKLAAAYLESGAKDRAVRELEEVMRTEPNFHAARYMLAQTYASLGAEEKSTEQLNVLRNKRFEHLERRVQNEYETRLIQFDWSLLPETTEGSSGPPTR